MRSGVPWSMVAESHLAQSAVWAFPPPLRGRDRDGGGGKLCARGLSCASWRKKLCDVVQMRYRPGHQNNNASFRGHPPPCPSLARGEGTPKQRTEQDETRQPLTMEPLSASRVFTPSDRTLPIMLARRAEEFGERPLVTAGEETWTYAQARDAAARFAGD